MTLKNLSRTENILSWVLAMIICPLGVCFAAKSGFGVSMIEAPVYVLHLKLSEFLPWYTFGTSEYILQAVLLAVMCLAVKKFKWQYLLSFATAFVYGLILDGWNYVFQDLTADTLLLRIVFAVFGCVGVAFAVAMFFRTSLPLEVWELFVKEIAENYSLNITKFKWIYDISSLLIGVVLMLLFFHGIKWDAIGIGTIITTAVNAPIIGFFSKLQDKFWNGLKSKCK